MQLENENASRAVPCKHLPLQLKGARPALCLVYGRVHSAGGQGGNVEKGKEGGGGGGRGEPDAI